MKQYHVSILSLSLFALSATVLTLIGFGGALDRALLAALISVTGTAMLMRAWRRRRPTSSAL
jgi:hypothetical protein